MTNPLKGFAKPEKSPLDPQECCDWANARLDGFPDQRRWVVTGDKERPIMLTRDCSRPLLGSQRQALLTKPE